MLRILKMSDWKTRVSDLFSTVESCGCTHIELNELTRTRIWDEMARKHGKRPVYSSYLQGYVQGLIDLRRDALYLTHLEFCFVGADGTQYSTRKGAARSTEEFYSAGRGCELNHLPKGHFWIKSGKPFYVGAA